MLYKYVSTNSKSFDSILNKQELYFASVKSMNDPFEGMPYFSFPSRTEIKHHLKKRGAKQNNINALVKQATIDLKQNQSKIAKLNEAYMKETGLLCMTPINDNLLMWAHYAGSHKGVCFGFDIKRPVDPVFGFGYDVIYKTTYPEISLLELDAVIANATSAFSVTNTELEKYIDKQLFTKAQCWEYENEIRFHRPPEAHGVGPLTFHKSQLKSVIFGYNYDKDKKAETIESMLNHYPDIDLYQARLSTRQYKLEIDRIQNTNELKHSDKVSCTSI